MNEKIRKPGAIILEDFHTSRENDDDTAVTRSRNGNVDIAFPTSRMHVIQRIGPEYRTRPHGLRDAGKLIAES